MLGRRCLPPVTSAPSPNALQPPTLTPMDTPHAPTRKPPIPGARRRGAPRGNQNGRKHGRYSKLKPADRYAALQKVLRSYGLNQPLASVNLTVEELLDDPKTNVRLLFLLLRTMIELFLIKERLRRL